MIDLNAVVERYVAGWNEPDPAARRRSVAAGWTADAVHYTPTREFRGHAAIEERLAEAYGQFVAGGAYRFRSQRNAAGHHDAVKFNWTMVSADAAESVVAIGFDLLLLDDDGRIRADWQFNDPQPDPRVQALADRYETVWHCDEPQRTALVTELWAADGVFLDHSCTARGPVEVSAVLGKALEGFAANDVTVQVRGPADGHHDAVRLPWRAAAGDGSVAANGLDLLILGPDRRIRLDYQFIEAS